MCSWNEQSLTCLPAEICRTSSVKNLVVNFKVEREIVENGVKSMNIKTPSITQRVGNLSGGNQQKVVLAKWPEDYKQNKETDEDTDIRFEEADDRPEDNVVLIPVEQFFFHLTAS